MRVGKLKEILNELDDSVLIVMSSDAEGNSYSPLAGWWEGIYVPDSTWSGSVYDPDDEEYGEYGEPEEAEDAEPCVVLWPTN